MSAFLTDTLVWTGALLAFVLLIRRPVAQIFGPKAAYALWALPMARLVLPPIVLPAWMAPAVEPAIDPALAMVGQQAMDDHLLAMASNAEVIAMARIAPERSLLDTLAGFDWASLLLPLWLTGAAVFLIRRYALYFQMRRDLLEAARPMGEAGRVRLVETPAADGPVAFGVIDQVIALPMGFMAGHDRAARDLALAHELAHHRGHDLVCNMLVQPLFALHWFNPLSLLGWRALRRDQEAACDARVMHHQPRESRAAYAAVIARFATQPKHAARLALAAPMACPVLGDRSIVQRLKSLKMTDISARRRWSGRLLIAAAALALPLTGSISYAQDDIAGEPTPPAPPAPPSPPSPPAAVTPPEAPEAPEPPSVTVSEDGRTRIVRIERNLPGAGAGKDRRIEKRIVIHPNAKLTAEQRAKLEKRMAEGKTTIRYGHRIEKKDGKLYKDGREMTAEERAEFEEDMAEMRRDMAEMRKELSKEFGKDGEMQRELERELGKHSEFQKEMREKFGANGEFQREMRVAIAQANAAARAGAIAAANAPRVTVRCRDGQKEVTETAVARDGKQTLFVCNKIAMVQARRDIASAREDIARARGMAEREREAALRSLDIAERELRAD